MNYELLIQLRAAQSALSDADFVTWCNTPRKTGEREYIAKNDLVRYLIASGLYPRLVAAQASANAQQAGVAISALAGIQTYTSIYKTDPLFLSLLSNIVGVGIATQGEVDAAMAALFDIVETPLAGVTLDDVTTGVALHNARTAWAEIYNRGVSILDAATVAPSIDELFAQAKV